MGCEESDSDGSSSSIASSSFLTLGFAGGNEVCDARAEGCNRWNCGIRGMTVLEIVRHSGQRNSFLSVSKLGG